MVAKLLFLMVFYSLNKEYEAKIQANFNIRLMKPQFDVRTAEERHPTSDQQRDETASLNLPHINSLSYDVFKESETETERYGMNDEDYDWMVKAMALYRKELARRRGQNMTDEEYSSLPLLIGDVMLTRQQMEHRLQQLNIPMPSRKKRKIENFITNPTGKWPLPIKYVIDSSFVAEEVTVIDAAVNEWIRQTCVTFEKHGATDTISEQYLKFYRNNSGCWSYNGRVLDLIPHPVNLESPGCLTLGGIPIHEIGHALGLHHEQSRVDRDSFVQIFWDNIEETEWSQFERTTPENSVTYNIPYDYGSIMHYSPQDFHKADNLYAILPNDTMLTSVLGQRSELSFYDAAIVNAAYCDDVCSTKLQCQNGGYTDPKNCSACRCPDGWGGKLCQTIATGSNGCSPLSGILMVAETKQSVQSENYALHGTPPYHGPFTQGSSCYWLLQAPANRFIKLWFSPWVGLLKSQEDDSCFHWIEIRHKKSHVTRGIRTCGYKAPLYNESNPLVSDRTDVMLLFKAPIFASIDQFNDANLYQGFQLWYQLVPDAANGLSTVSTSGASITSSRSTSASSSASATTPTTAKFAALSSAAATSATATTANSMTSTTKGTSSSVSSSTATQTTVKQILPTITSFSNVFQQCMLDMRINRMNWTDDLANTSSATFSASQQLVCNEMARIASNSVAGIQFCSASFRKGSVYASVLLTLSSTITSDQVDSIRTLLTQRLANDNALGIDASTFNINLLKDGATDVCLSRPCDQICISSSGGSYFCKCYSGFSLYNANTCKSNSEADGSLIVIIAASVAAIFVTVLVVLFVCCLLSQKHKSSKPEQSLQSYYYYANKNLKGRDYLQGHGYYSSKFMSDPFHRHPQLQI